MIVVDSSVWISALRSKGAPETAILDSLLDADEVALPAPVRVELLAGASNAARTPLRRALTALPVLYPEDSTWKLIDRWIDQAGQKGHRFHLGDLLIAALTFELGGLVWSLDKDFARMDQLGLVGIYEP